MKIRFDNRKIANTCTFIAYTLIIIITILGIIAIADMIFRWDILSGTTEKLAYLIMWASVIIILGTFLISLMVNMNIISNSVEELSKNRSLNNNDE